MAGIDDMDYQKPADIARISTRLISNVCHYAKILVQYCQAQLHLVNFNPNSVEAELSVITKIQSHPPTDFKVYSYVLIILYA